MGTDMTKWGGNGNTQTRTRASLYPDFAAEIEAIRQEGDITAEIVQRILEKHLPNAAFNRSLYQRYEGIDLPIFHRGPRFLEEQNAINNKINNDFFGDIVDFFVGHFAGKPIGYSYSVTGESEEVTGGREAVAKAGKALTDFVTRNNMMDKDMETAKYAAVCGYAARLFYHDPEGQERVMVVPPFEAAILTETDLTEPCAAVRYFQWENQEGQLLWQVQYYDERRAVLFCGEKLDALRKMEERPHLYGLCPLQGIPKNGEMMGDAEKVLLAIDAYDRALSDAGNDIEAFANAYMVFDNVNISPEQIARGQKSGAFQYFQGGGTTGKIYFLTKDVNDAFVEHHLNRLEENIYRFSKTPNLSDGNFSQNASGVALKYKLAGMETKCGIFQAKMMNAGVYMFRLLANSWTKRQIWADPLQCLMDFSRNFPLDITSEAQAVQALIAAGLPERVAYGTLSFVEDVDWVMQLKEGEAAREVDETEEI